MSSAGVDATRYLDHVRALGAEPADLGDAVVVALHPSAAPSRGKRLVSPFAAAVRPRGTAVTITPHGPGPAVAAITIELLAELGVRRVVGVGIGSWVDREPAITPTAIVAEQSASDDSVTATYGAAPADAALVAELTGLLDAPAARTFTTATPFRLDVDRVQASGATMIDMESAALFAAASSRGIAAAAVILPSDVTGPSGWRALPSPEPAVAAIANRIRRHLVEEK